MAANNRDDKAMLEAIRNINASVTSKQVHYYSKKRFNGLVKFLENEKINNKFSLPPKFKTGVSNESDDDDKEVSELDSDSE